ncbi:hypothetical protein GCM10023091_23750 [Ravibacter arvi]|uniref:Lipoprotein n=1 Tax=Ravibacter arvi TaxID=2051041 RepID=A0ABP8M0A3_9BACT
MGYILGLKYAILLSLVGGALAGCCTMVMCVGADNMNEIALNNFEDAAELDTIVVKKYNKGSGMVTPIDSFVTFPVFSGAINPTQQIVLSQKMTDNFDYRIEIPGAGRVYNITNFVVKKKGCNSGFLCNDTYRALESYRVNGRTMEGQWQVVLYR